MSFMDEFNRRLRVVIGAPEGAEVGYDEETRTGGYCDTCAYTEQYIETWWIEETNDEPRWPGDSGKRRRLGREFNDLGELMRALDDVPDLDPF
jgi:hypothetical protein